MIRAFFIYLGVAVVGIIFFALMVLIGIPAIQNSSIALAGLSSGSSKNDNTAIDKQSIDAEINKLQKKLDSYTPSDAFIIVNTCENHFYLYKDKKLILNGLCSTGKNERLIRMTKKGRKEYVFYTPKGVRIVQRKQENPVWSKPDWAFVEEGLPIPPPGDPSRIESGTLGDYKLELGDNYMIHGTLYKRFMGQNVTHGCIRLGDEDLEIVYNTLQIGSKVYIY